MAGRKTTTRTVLANQTFNRLYGTKPAVERDVLTVANAAGVRVCVQGYPPMQLSYKQAADLDACLQRVLHNPTHPVAATYTEAQRAS